ncbi:NUDIX domain-containing protein [Paenibacillus koleovorans]|uniref:NUDIX domain-containing protein n=1 Tax=Paenibacillus koleovorans TaxID=121608 RepID=UPI001FEB4F0F|nr:NUDIX hydrolase [Paenibacillus koleovorans]
MSKYKIKARVTGILVEDGKLLLVKHSKPVAPGRFWSLPGGKLERGETLETGMLREMKEETGLDVQLGSLLYVCDKPEEEVSRIHFLFQLKRTSEDVQVPSNEFDENAILAVRWVPLEQLADPEYSFTPLFQDLALSGFPGAGEYKGHKSNIGL